MVSKYAISNGIKMSVVKVPRGESFELSSSLSSHSYLLLGGSYVKWFSDSQNACKIIQVGSMRNDLHATALEIFQFCTDCGIELEVQ